MDGGLELTSVEQQILRGVYELIEKMGYKGGKTTGNQKQHVVFDKVEVKNGGIFRMVVVVISTDEIEEAVTFTITFDPVNKRGLLFDKYLESVTVRLVGVNKNITKADNYRECVVELLQKDPQFHTKALKYYLLKTLRMKQKTEAGVKWLDERAKLTAEEALGVVEVMNRLFIGLSREIR